MTTPFDRILFMTHFGSRSLYSTETTRRQTLLDLERTKIALVASTTAVVICGIFYLTAALIECSKRQAAEGLPVHCYEADISCTDILINVGSIALGTLLAQVALPNLRN